MNILLADVVCCPLQVRMLIGLIRKVTGVTISAFFKNETGSTYSGREMEMPWHSNSGFGHNVRKYRMRCALACSGLYIVEIVVLGYRF